MSFGTVTEAKHNKADTLMTIHRALRAKGQSGRAKWER
jgi:hypothetical protein